MKASFIYQNTNTIIKRPKKPWSVETMA